MGSAPGATGAGTTPSVTARADGAKGRNEPGGSLGPTLGALQACSGLTHAAQDLEFVTTSTATKLVNGHLPTPLFDLIYFCSKV